MKNKIIIVLSILLVVILIFVLCSNNNKKTIKTDGIYNINVNGDSQLLSLQNKLKPSSLK